MTVITPKDLVTTSFVPEVADIASSVPKAYMSFNKAFEEGYTKWAVMFSGGKDSTAIAVLACEWMKVNPNKKVEITFVYSDTNVEIPTLALQSSIFLQHLSNYGNIEVVRPRPEKTFWVLHLGKGYPAPHQKFRWCTDKLKIDPTKDIINSLKKSGKVAIFTGVRFGESDVRDQSMYSACSRGGECGQGIWMKESEGLGVGYFAPIAFWRQCDVWDYVNFEAYRLGYPTENLETIYNGRDSRFGCWTCTVVQQDKTMKRIVETTDGEKFKPLLALRDFMKSEATKEDNRVIRPSGQKGRLNLNYRKKLLDMINLAEVELGFEIISSSERSKINQIWNDPKYGDTYQTKR